METKTNKGKRYTVITQGQDMTVEDLDGLYKNGLELISVTSRSLGNVTYYFRNLKKNE